MSNSLWSNMYLRDCVYVFDRWLRLDYQGYLTQMNTSWKGKTALENSNKQKLVC